MLWRIKEDYNCFMSSVTLFELYCGAKTDRHFLDISKLCIWIRTIPFDDKIAELSSTIYGQLKSENKMIEFRDIFIAATAIAEGLYAATLNRGHFERIKDLDLL